MQMQPFFFRDQLRFSSFTTIHQFLQSPVSPKLMEDLSLLGYSLGNQSCGVFKVVPIQKFQYVENEFQREMAKHAPLTIPSVSSINYDSKVKYHKISIAIIVLRKLLGKRAWVFGLQYNFWARYLIVPASPRVCRHQPPRNGVGPHLPVPGNSLICLSSMITSYSIIRGRIRDGEVHQDHNFDSSSPHRDSPWHGCKNLQIRKEIREMNTYRGASGYKNRFIESKVTRNNPVRRFDSFVKNQFPSLGFCGFCDGCIGCFVSEYPGWSERTSNAESLQ